MPEPDNTYYSSDEYFYFTLYVLECVLCRISTSGFVGDAKYRIRRDSITDTFVFETTKVGWLSQATNSWNVYKILKGTTFETTVDLIRRHLCSLT